MQMEEKRRSCVLKKLESYLSMKRRNKKAGGGGVAPTGCFPVYVGPTRQRFVVRAEFANHPLFKMLLEDAEMEYGFTSEGPLLLPCEVDLFCKVLGEMDCDDDHQGGFGYASCSPFNRMGKHGYGLLTPPRLLN